jgi:hypothetical protein
VTRLNECITYGIVGKVIDSADKSIGVALADSESINGAIQGAKKPEQKLHHEHHGRHRVRESKRESPWSQDDCTEGLSAALIYSHPA